MVNFEITGVISQIGPLREGVNSESGKPWARRTVVINQTEADRELASVSFDLRGDRALEVKWKDLPLVEGMHVSAQLGCHTHQSAKTGAWWNELYCFALQRC